MFSFRKKKIMDFSWFGVTIIDVGVVSVSVIGFAWLFGRIATLEKQLATQKLEHETQIVDLKSEHGKEIANLQKEIADLQEENRTLRAKIAALAEENRILQKNFDILSGRYAEIKEMLSIFLKDEAMRNSTTV